MHARDPRDAEEGVDLIGDLSECLVDRLALAEVRDDDLREACDRRLDAVEGVHIGAEVDEDLAERAAHARRCSGDDDRLPGVSEIVVHR